MKNKKAFTLIEVVVATSILMISVFWVYKLIGENAKLINNNDNYLQLHSLFPTLKSCIDEIWYYSTNVWDIKKYDFWSDMLWCSKSINNPLKVILDNIEYNLSSKVLSWGIDFIDFELKISGEGVWSYTGSYKLLK